MGHFSLSDLPLGGLRNTCCEGRRSAATTGSLVSPSVARIWRNTWIQLSLQIVSFSGLQSLLPLVPSHVEWCLPSEKQFHSELKFKSFDTDIDQRSNPWSQEISHFRQVYQYGLVLQCKKACLCARIRESKFCPNWNSIANNMFQA